MLKSKDIADFIEAKTSDLRPDEPVPVDLYLYFKSNSHVLLWKPAGTAFSVEVVKSLVGRGIESVWVHKSEWDRFSSYLNSGVAPTPQTKREYAPDNVIEAYRPQVLSQELVYGNKKHQQLLDVLRDDTREEREKKASVAILSRSLLGELASAKTLEQQKVVNHEIASVVYRFMKEAKGDSQGLASEIFEISRLNPEFLHSANVATLAVLFAMAFGKIDEQLLLETGVAALFHDVGVTQLPFQLAQVTWEVLTPEQMTEYLKHREASVELIQTFAPSLSERVLRLVTHHHDDYSAPDALTPISDVSQLISLADLLDSLCSGKRDGQERTLTEAISEAESRQLKTFNREVLTAVFRWIRENLRTTQQIEDLTG